MSNPSEDAARPAKRARLDDDSAPAFSPSTSTGTLAAAEQPILAATAAIDADLEREVRAGITEYVCPDNLGFTGVLKQRYTDFLVNEIGLDGRVLHLTNTEVETKNQKRVESDNATKIAEEEKPVETSAKDDKADAVMQDGGVGEVTLPVPAPVPAEPKETEIDGEEILGQVKATKQEPGEAVSTENRLHGEC
jgi:tRNA pseudouridine13 synthase